MWFKWLYDRTNCVVTCTREFKGHMVTWQISLEVEKPYDFLPFHFLTLLVLSLDASQLPSLYRCWTPCIFRQGHTSWYLSAWWPIIKICFKFNQLKYTPFTPSIFFLLYICLYMQSPLCFPDTFLSNHHCYSKVTPFINIRGFWVHLVGNAWNSSKCQRHENETLEYL